MKSSINVRYNVYAPKAKGNCTTHLNRATRTTYQFSQFKVLRGASSLEQMCLLGHASTKQSCEIQCEALEFSRKHTFELFIMILIYATMVDQCLLKKKKKNSE